MNKSRTNLLRCLLLYLCVFLAATPLRAQTTTHTAASLTPGPKPPDVPVEWKQLVGIYAHDKDFVVILERNKVLFWQRYGDFQLGPLIAINVGADGALYLSARGLNGELLSLRKTNSDNVVGVTLMRIDYVRKDAVIDYDRKDAGADPAHFFHVKPAKPVEELRAAAVAAKLPEEVGPFRKPELVELTTLDPAFHLDIRYAQANNFLSTPLYTQARAFLQRPAAEALLRVLRKLQPLGYGLLIHDAYRPWYVTKLFWDATPPEDHNFVADPQKGSKHNRGCAVDLTLYDLASGNVIEMPGLYDEMSPRSFPTFPGGTSLQRWHRDLLRRAMESEGFTVDQNEWWHFDYKEWRTYPILNVTFEKLDKLAN